METFKENLVQFFALVIGAKKPEPRHANYAKSHFWRAPRLISCLINPKKREQRKQKGPRSKINIT